ncbi:MAG: site-specific integrase [bacterium]|nr:site-specific integrase [bacterium]
MKNELTPKISSTPSLLSKSYRAAQDFRRDQAWAELASISVGQALAYWLETLGGYTRRNYYSGFKALAALGLFDADLSLQDFALINQENRVDEIKHLGNWSEATKQARAAAYIGFTGYLQRRTQGLISKAIANREGGQQTFFKVRHKVKTEALSEAQTQAFFAALAQLNPRDALLAKMILQGGKRKGEVLGLMIEQIDFERRMVRFLQSKTKGLIKETHITYPVHLMQELISYLKGRKQGPVFITRNGRPLAATQLDRNFAKAGELAGIPFRVSPHVLRVTLVTRLKERKVQDSDIIKITGHASPVQLLAYDKSDLADNASSRFDFV